MKNQFKMLTALLAGLFTLHPEMKAKEEEIQAAIDQDATAFAGQIDELNAKVTGLTAERDTLQGQLATAQQQLADEQSALAALKAETADYESLKAFHAEYKGKINGITPVGGKQTGGLTDEAQARKEEFERIQAEYADMLK